jgi:hypothetical protein
MLSAKKIAVLMGGLAPADYDVVVGVLAQLSCAPGRVRGLLAPAGGC